MGTTQQADKCYSHTIVASEFLNVTVTQSWNCPKKCPLFATFEMFTLKLEIHIFLPILNFLRRLLPLICSFSYTYFFLIEIFTAEENQHCECLCLLSLYPISDRGTVVLLLLFLLLFLCHTHGTYPLFVYLLTRYKYVHLVKKYSLQFPSTG